jgi:16S rRNA (guanine966-N2)-methyltransferase
MSIPARPRGPAQRVRIIGGEWRRRLITFPPLPDLRPTPDRVRETVFNWLGQDLHGLRCLDLFAGSGALGFEAASRGARRVVMVEQDARAVHSLQDNCRLLAAATVEVVRADARQYLERAARDAARGDGDEGGGALQFDVVFLDPPFRLNMLPQLLPSVARCLAEGGWVYVEAPVAAAFEADAGWQIVRQARAGAVDYRLLARAAGSAQTAADPATLGS